MHWILQSDIYREEGYESLRDAIRRMDIPNTEVKMIPFSHEIVPEPVVENPAVVMGSISLCNYAKEKGWAPGAFINGYNFNHSAYKCGYGKHLLNYDAHVVKFGEADTADPNLDVFFLRPYDDSKCFAGEIISRCDFQDWQEKVRRIQDENYTTISTETVVTVASVKKILREYRFFVVDGRVITGSLYKMGNRVTYQSQVDDDVSRFAQRMTYQFEPDRAFVLDIALTEDGFKVIEVNCFNAAGFYACDVTKIIHAVEGMSGL